MEGLQILRLFVQHFKALQILKRFEFEQAQVFEVLQNLKGHNFL